MPDSYDIAIIGAGPGGYVAAIRAGQLGMKVICIDKNAALGGTCLNIGCIPSKALLDSSELFALAKSRFAENGIRVGDLSLDLKAMMERKNRVVKGLTDGVAFLFKKNHVVFVQAAARLADANRVQLKMAAGKDDVIEAKSIVLATGSAPIALPALPFDGARIVSSTEAIAFDKVPEHLIIVGAGYIGLELGSVWARLGARVTVVEFLPRILPQADAEIASVMHKSLSKQGLELHVATKVTGGSVQGNKVVVTAEGKAGKVQFEGDKVLVAVGRKPVTAGLGLEEAGVKIDERTGQVVVGDNFKTTKHGVYAIGDLIAGPMLAHKAQEEGVAVVENLAGQKTQVNYGTIPSVVYTWPEAASVGLTEEQVKESGRDYRVGKFPFFANGRARCLGETEGLVKLIADAETDRLLGAHIIGPRASELIAETVLAMEFAGSAEDIALTCHAHPTLSEATHEAALAVAKRAIHA
jgi:dihydrolipoamide dehydrogenase